MKITPYGRKKCGSRRKRRAFGEAPSRCRCVRVQRPYNGQAEVLNRLSSVC